MNRRIFTFVSIAVVVASFSIIAFGWSSWSSTQRRTKSKTEKPRARQQSADAAPNGQPDTRRDVFIAARRAPQSPAIGDGTWINSKPLDSESLRGRVVLVDFWTFGCYNCRNTLPTLKRLDAQYRDKGLTILGVHSPESDYEKNLANVRREVRELGINYPVVTDTDYTTWRAFNVQAWPTVVILDKQGRIRFTHIGEGLYKEQEQVIQKLLAEDADAVSTNEITPAPDSEEGAAALGIRAIDSEESKTVMPEKITKTDAEWKQQLTAEEYRVLREKGTERAFTGAYADSHEHGTFVCAACGQELFSSDKKFESGTGWPSFYAPVSDKSVREERDRSYGMTRTEVVCNRCESHLGHVFDDGPQPTGLRYCINSVALKLAKS